MSSARHVTYRLAIVSVVVMFGCFCASGKPRVRNSVAGTTTLPFTIELGEPFTIPGMPGRQDCSHAVAQSGDQTRYLLVGGAGKGLHGFAIPNETSDGDNFPASDSDDSLWVIDIHQRKVWSMPLARVDTPDLDIDALRATSAQYFQDGKYLYIAGGYGHSANATTPGKFVTFDTLTVLDVDAVVRSVVEGTEIGESIRQIRHPMMKVTGGGMQKLNKKTALVFGQRFDGLYSPLDRGNTFRQRYTRQIRTFQVETSPALQLTEVEFAPRYPAPSTRPLGDHLKDPHRRRDLNVLPVIAPDMTAQVAVFGGVFQPGRFDGFVHPIYIDGFVQEAFLLNGAAHEFTTFSPGVDESFEQLMNHYDCATLSLFDDKSRDMYTVFFGGISSYWYDRTTGTLVKDKLKLDPVTGRPLVDGLPFVRTVTTLHRGADGTSSQLILRQEMPGFLGTNAVLFEEPALPRFQNGVLRLNLDAIEKKTLIGHIYGGIESLAPYSAEKGTTTSDRFIPVYLSPGQLTVDRMPPKP